MRTHHTDSAKNSIGRPTWAVTGTALALATLSSAAVFAQAAFDPAINFPGGDGMRGVVSVDLNGDGAPDLASANKSGNSVSVLLNNGTGAFASPVDYAAGVFPMGIVSADFNLDGTPDLAAANNASGTVSLLFNQGDGSFVAGASVATGPEPSAIAAGDLDGNGSADLAVANQATGSVSILLNDGVGGFARAAGVPVGPQPASLVTTDLDGDGVLDLAVMSGGSQVAFITPTLVRHFSVVHVALGNGDGSFQPSTVYEVTQNPSQIIAADFNRDGSPDLAIANHIVSSAPPHSWVSLLLNNRDGTFSAEIRVATRQGADASLTAPDLDGDSAPDLVTAGDWTPGEIEVMLNDGRANFGPPTGFDPGGLNAPSFVVSGDYDLDGDADVVAASRFSDNFALYLNQLVPNPPRVSGDPDLIGNVSRLRVKPNKGTFQIEVEAVIENIGTGSTGGLFTSAVYLSDDAVLDTAQDLRIGTFFTLGNLVAGQSDKQKLKQDLRVSPIGKYLLIDIDPNARIAESDKTNNVAGRLIQ